MASQAFAVGDRIQYRDYPLQTERTQTRMGTIVRESTLGAGYRVLPDGSKAERYVSKERIIGPAPTPDPVVPAIRVGTEVRVDHEALGQHFGRVIQVEDAMWVRVRADAGAIFRVPIECCTPKAELVDAFLRNVSDYNEGYSTEGYDPPTERTLAAQEALIERLRSDNKALSQRIERQRVNAINLAKRNTELSKENGRFLREAEAAERNLRLATSAINRAKNNVCAIIEDDDEEF